MFTITRSNAHINALYKMYQHTIERPSEIRDLGLQIGKKFTLITHIEKVIASARQSLGFIKKISRNSFLLATQTLLYEKGIKQMDWQPQ